MGEPAHNQSFSILSGIRDNWQRGTVGEFLSDKIREGSRLSFVSAYFTIYAYAALKQKLCNAAQVRFLFGEPSFIKGIDPLKGDKKSFLITPEGLRLAYSLQQKSLAKECADWISKKVDVRSLRKDVLLHGKMYHISTDGFEDDAILGSSNLTVRGLGLSRTINNIELNLEVDSRRDRKDLKAWFDELWMNDELTKDVKAEVLEYLGQIYQHQDPEFVYFKTLFHLFNDSLTKLGETAQFDEHLKVTDTHIWKALYEFQKDGVKGAINKILTHNGCVLADSVGLGKTFEALAIIKYFELRNENVLVLCPRRLRDNWTVYRADNNSALNPFLKDRLHYTVLSHSDLSRESGNVDGVNLETLNWANYDLVVIDESHNFRNNIRGQKDLDGNTIRKSRYERLMEDVIKGGVKTKVLLLSATPVNNSLRDLRNQLYFISEGDDHAFEKSIGIGSLQAMLGAAQQQFMKWSREPSETRRSENLIDHLSPLFFKLLDELTIARSRKHIRKYYQENLKAIGGFPERLPPKSEFPDIDLADKFMSYDRLNDEILRYRLSLFNPSLYIRDEFQPLYEDKTDKFRQSLREHYLIGMMKVNFLKRLESSVYSFQQTMARTITNIEVLERKLIDFQQRNRDEEIEAVPLQQFETEDDEADFIGKGKSFLLSHLDIDRWLVDLKADKQQLNSLYLQAKDVMPERDAKMAKLKEIIRQKIEHPNTTITGRLNRKVLVFTAFADTAKYLFDNLKDWARKDLGIHIALVTGGTYTNQSTLGGNEFSEILTNFSPISKKRAQIKSLAQGDEIDLLIATDCISEGQNLQDCDFLVNYDIHWNPVRIIQRFGRIDRIGSINKVVQLVNFWPTQDLNKYINLKNRVEARMALVDVAASSNDNLLNVEEIQELASDEIQYRDRQLLRLQKEILDLEDFNDGVSLGEFSLEDFRIELSRYSENYIGRLQEAPLGLYAVTEPGKDKSSIAPGVIFCLRQKNGEAASSVVNPLQPYFLVYVGEDGTIKSNFSQSRHVLEVFRDCCAGESVADVELNRLFDQETNDGSKMDEYSDLLDKVIQAVEQNFRRRMLGALQTGNAIIPRLQAQIHDETDFDLITWLVIKRKANV